MNEHAEFELLDAYALKTLDESEAARVRAHLASCTGCRAELGELQAVLDVLPHGLPQLRPSARVRERIFAQLDPAAPARRPGPPAAFVALAAALVLAVGLDVWLAAALRNAQRAQPKAPDIALATPAARPAPVRPVPVSRVPVRSVPVRSASAVRPSAAPSAAPAPDPALRRRVAELEYLLSDESARARRDGVRDRERIERLQRGLAEARASVVALERLASVPTPAPAPVASAAAQSPELVAALSTGRVYGIDGVVGSEPWHLTIVQPLAGKDAIIYTRTPDAPTGDTYRTWVLRGGATFDAGELPPAAQTELQMPMPLQSGDEVAFSREPVGTGDRPTSPFLMKVTIGP